MIINLWQILSVTLSIVLIVFFAAPSISGLLFISESVKVELFIMSHCPFGTQAEKGVLPAIQALGRSVDFKLRFVYYVMHGKTEIDEQLNQYCIQENEPSKLINYLNCFLEAGDGEACLLSTGINANLLSSCVSETDEEFNITELYDDRSSWLSGRYPLFGIDVVLNQEYGVRGSPTLVINGEQASPANRSPQAFLDTICDHFDSKPAVCSQQLSTQVPSSGFGFSGSSGSSGSCA